jgi:hypothetical protein
MRYAAEVTYTAYTWGRPGSNANAATSDVPHEIKASAAITARTETEARRKLEKQFRGRHEVVEVLGITLAANPRRVSW